MHDLQPALADSDESDQDALIRQATAKRSTLVSVAVNIVLALAQVVTGILASSQSLIADGVHSLADLVSDFVVLVASHHSQKAPDEDHHYGHQRYENAASLTLGALLLLVGLGMLWSAVGRIGAPDAIPKVGLIGLWVALAALAAKEILFRYLLAAAVKVRSSLLIANAWHARSDAASSLVVVIGIGGNLLGYPVLDPVAALIVGLMVARMGWGFAWVSLHDLMDRAVDQETVNGIHQSLLETPGVLGLHGLKTRKVGDLTLVDVHLEVDADMTVEQGHDIALHARRRAMAQHQVLNVMTHVDPVRPQD